MGHGKRCAIPGLDSHACSIFATIGIANIFPSGLWPCTAISRLVESRGQMNCESRPIEQDSFGPHADAVGASLPTFLTICDREHA